MYDNRLSYHGCRSLITRGPQLNRTLQSAGQHLPVLVFLACKCQIHRVHKFVHRILLCVRGQVRVLSYLLSRFVVERLQGREGVLAHIIRERHLPVRSVPPFLRPDCRTRTWTQRRQSTFSKLHGVRTPILGSMPSLDTIRPTAITLTPVIPCTMEDRATCCRGLPGSAQMY